MLPFPSALFARQSPMIVPQYDGPAADLDFVAGAYRVGGVDYASLSDIPGLGFTRSGEQGAVEADGSVNWFAADIPAINGKGFHAFGALTNHVRRSQGLDLVWGPYLSVSLSGTEVAAAPDGSVSADEITFSGSDGIYFQSIAGPASGPVTLSIWAKVAAGAMPFRLYVLDGLNRLSPDFVASTEWQRFVFIWDVQGGSNQFAILPGEGGASGALQIWQAQLLGGDMPEGGPPIRTAASVASIGASALAIPVPNGNYTATYTFDDNSTQIVPTSVTGGQFIHPALGVLNRAIVKRMTLVTAPAAP